MYFNEKMYDVVVNLLCLQMHLFLENTYNIYAGKIALLSFHDFVDFGFLKLLNRDLRVQD